MRSGSLFTGVGGLDLAVDAALGAEPVWMCESDPHARRILERHWPGVPVLPDVRELDAGTPRVDVLHGGFPCQDLSVAGRGLGLVGDRSALWFAYADAIRTLRPRLVIVENVPGIFSKMGRRAGESAFGSVIADLAEAGYVGSWVCVRASDIRAPHRRERVFVVAWNTEGQPERRPVGRDVDGCDRPDVAWDETQPEIAADATGRRVAHEQDGRNATGLALSTKSRAGDRDRTRDPSKGAPVDRRGTEVVDWGKYEPAIRQWEHLTGTVAPRPTDDRGRLMPELVEWMMGLPVGWTDGIKRTHRLRCLGNAVVPQQAALAIRALMEGGA